MTRRLDTVLTTDGTSDRVLVPILRWLLSQHGCADARVEWLNPALVAETPSLRARARAAVGLFPCDVLFVHRDAEGQSREARVEEVRQALAGSSVPEYVCVIPVRMTEAWLLFDHAAVRRASGNPNGTAALSLPKAGDAERATNPKRLLHQSLFVASGLRGRRKDKLRPTVAAHRVAELIEDFAPLRELAAFRALESDVERVTRAWLARGSAS